MGAVSEWIAREYFESLGYLVTQPRKFVVPGRLRRGEEDAHLLVCNPRVLVSNVPGHLVWGTSDLAGVARAVVGVRGWHTERFTARTFELVPEILRFAEDRAVKRAAEHLGGDVCRVLCLPELPASGALREQTIAMLQERKINGVITFRTMLLELIRSTDPQKNYEKSDLLQIIRVLKAYELLNDGQMSLFPRSRAAARRRGGAAAT